MVDVFDPIAGTTNATVSAYSRSIDAFHRETFSPLFENVPARVVSGVDKARTYRRDRNAAETIVYGKVVYISAIDAGVNLSRLQIRDKIIIDGEEHRVSNIYFGYDLNGNLIFARIYV